ncbi:His-Xaa-Ser system protein HxsD [Anaeromicropila herbilytica]|uniref:His-Xaa-Ser system protein HxsD n=1 Tax=Anaeromicropila herbilytica TaxID=2785025 RepID=A0A7R7EM80_9FIRM|nr:His-Xaa-Ser system protein HxsD [Anaeromicropila herbilytica]BCN31082.1 hypothetical protein bsdtb5_23770 [Anaeromicropila herbilytica]
MQYKFNKELYLQKALMKAAYSFTDRAYVHLDCDKSYYIVSVDMKDNLDVITEKEFQNELLAQMVRLQISQETKSIRELVMARAFASSIIESTEEVILQPEEAKEINIEKILKDWFEINE